MGNRPEPILSIGLTRRDGPAAALGGVLCGQRLAQWVRNPAGQRAGA